MFDVMSWLENMSRNTKGEPQFVKKLGEHIEGLVDRMRHLGANGAKGVSGKVTIELSLDLEGNEIHTSPKISVKYPSEALTASRAYIGPDGALWDHDPRQYQFEFKGGGVSSRTEAKGEKTDKSTAGATGHEIKSPSR